jgi:hypothetical protein
MFATFCGIAALILPPLGTAQSQTLELVYAKWNKKDVVGSIPSKYHVICRATGKLAPLGSESVIRGKCGRVEMKATVMVKEFRNGVPVVRIACGVVTAPMMKCEFQVPSVSSVDTLMGFQPDRWTLLFGDSNEAETTGVLARIVPTQPASRVSAPMEK